MSTTDELLESARELLTARTVPGWPRATAVLIRQALEAAVDGLWLQKEPQMVEARWRSKLIALVDIVPARDAGMIRTLWAQLSGACHVHEYELPPTSGELRRWIEAVHGVVGRL